MVWSGFAALLFASVMATVVVYLPPADFWRDRQPAVEQIFGSTPRIIAASILAFWCGSFVNSFVLAKMKILTQGRWLWTRTIGSTLCGEFIDTVLFSTIAFAGTMTRSELLTVMVTQYVLKSGWEVVSTPITYKLVNFLKRAEGEDFYDRNTNFTPFSLRVPMDAPPRAEVGLFSAAQPSGFAAGDALNESFLAPEETAVRRLCDLARLPPAQADAVQVARIAAGHRRTHGAHAWRRPGCAAASVSPGLPGGRRADVPGRGAAAHP